MIPGGMVDILQIAKVCHAANRAYCQTIGDSSQFPWQESPDWQRESAIKGVEFHLSHLTVGEKVLPSASHESWMEEKKSAGWKYGPVKDAEKKEHPCFLPYDQLPSEQRIKDYIFSGIVEAFYRESIDRRKAVSA